MAGNLFEHRIRDPGSRIQEVRELSQIKSGEFRNSSFLFVGFQILILDTEPDQGPGLNNWFQPRSRDPDPGFGTRIQTKELGS
jgi:hypothetical protein